MSRADGAVDLVMGIDLGSQSAKIVVHDRAGRLVTQAQRALAPPVSVEPGRVEHPGEDLWETTAAACAEVVAALGPRVEHLVAVGLCGIRFCRAPMRADGSLAAPVRSWMDSRGEAGLPVDAVQVVASSAYLTARLTGAVRDSSAAYALGQTPADDLVEPGEVLGVVTPGASAATGLPRELPVVATGNDKAVEALGCGLLDPGRLLVSLGTYVASMTVGDADASGRSYWTNPAAVPGRVLHESVGVRRGMWTVSWMRDLVGGHVGEGDEEALGRAAERVPVGSDGLLTVLDWLAPPEAPWRRGSIVGLDDRHGPAHLYRSVLEAVAVTVSVRARAMLTELGLDVGGVLLSGGGGGGGGVGGGGGGGVDGPVGVLPVASAAGLGASISAAVGVGLHRSWSDAVDAMVPRAELLEPDPAGVTAYADVSDRHRALAEALDPVMRRNAR